MKSSGQTFLLGLWATVVTFTASATTVLVDFNNINTSTLVANDPTPAPGSDGLYYNNVLLPYGGGAGTSASGTVNINGSASLALTNTVNALSGWTLSLSKNNSSGAVGPSGSVANYAGPYPAAVSAFAATAIKDGIYLNNGAIVTVTISGLDTTKTYDLLAYGARGNNGGHSLPYTLSAGTSASPSAVSFDPYNNSTVAPAWTSIAPAAGGTIAFSVSAAGGTSGYVQGLSFLRLTEAAGNPPIIVSFTASVSTFALGDSVTLSWNVTNATSVAINQGIGTVAATGSVVVTPGATTTYTLTALNGATPATAQITLTLSSGPVDVYLLGGQSNMQGLGDLSELTPAQLTPPTNVFYWNGSGFVPLVPGTTITSSAGNFGPEIAFATQVAKPGRKAYLIKEYNSGKPLDSGWDDQTWVGDPPVPNRVNFYPGTNATDVNQGTLYKNELLPMYQAGIQAIIAQGGTPVIRGLIWMQGEQDSKTNISAGRYAANLKRLRDRLANDLGLPNPTNLPVTFGQVLPFTPPAPRFVCRDLVRVQQAAADMFSGLPEAISHCRMVSTDGYPVYSSDLVHYTTAGQLMLGTAFAQGLQEAALGVNLTPTNLTSNVSGGTLTLSWPADHLGWRLLVQTNHLAEGITTNTNDWTTVAGSSLTNQASILLNATTPTQFYRLVYP
jgi:hypothetical protein